MKNIIFSGLLAMAIAGAAAAQSDTTYTNKRGDTVQRSASGTGDVSKTVTGPNGKSATIDKSVDGRTVDKSVTGPNGKTVTSENTRTRNGVVKEQTGPNGNKRVVVKKRR